MDGQRLLERYAALGDEDDFLAAKAQLEGSDDPEHVSDYGFLLYAHARNELRLAVVQLERAIELDPNLDKPVYQLISAYAALREPERAVDLCRARLAAAPGSVREHGFLAHAYCLAGDWTRALEIADAGLAFAPDDALLVAVRGEVKAQTGDPEGALADWRDALALDRDNIGPLYSSAFLLEREGRLDEAAEAWRSIIAWCDERGYELDTVWPRQELERVLSRGSENPS
jgi:tetratricopeptide (TPR) repeat protein